MQGTYTHIPETNYVPREHGVAAILLFLFMVLISLLAVLNLLYFYISTFIIIIIIIIGAIQLSLGGSSPYTSMDKTNRKNIHKRNNTKTQYKQYKTQ